VLFCLSSFHRLSVAQTSSLPRKNLGDFHEEIKKALQVEKQRKAEGYRVIPILLPGIKPSALKSWFKKEPAGVQIKEGGLQEALPNILAALGEKLPDDHQPTKKIDARPVEELVLKLVDPKIITHEGKHHALRRAVLADEDNSGRLIHGVLLRFPVLRIGICGERRVCDQNDPKEF